MLSPPGNSRPNDAAQPVPTEAILAAMTPAKPHTAKGTHLDGIRIGDEITVRYKVTHIGMPGALAGVAIPGNGKHAGIVLGFTASDIVSVTKRAFSRGEIVRFTEEYSSSRGTQTFRVQHVEDGFATIVQTDAVAGRTIPTVVTVTRLQPAE